MAPLDEGDDPFEARAVGALAPEAVAVLDVHLVVAALEQSLTGPARQGPPRGVHVEAEVVAERRHRPLEVLGRLGPLCPRGNGPLREGQVVVRHDELGIDLELGAQAGAGGAGAEGRVEGEGTRLDLVDAQRVVVGAGHRLGVPALPLRVVLVEVDEVDDEDAPGQPEGGLDGVGDPLLRRTVLRTLGHEAVDDHVDRVLDLLFESRRLRERDDLAVDHGAAVPLRPQLGEEVDELALAGPHHRREDLEACPVGQLEEPIDDLLRTLPGDRLAAHGAMRPPHPGVEEAQVVVDLGDRADRRARVAVRRLLVDGDRRRQTLDEVDVGLVHLPEELPGVGGQGLHVAPLALGEDRVEGERGLARSREAGEDHERVPGDVDMDVLEVVLAGSLDDDPVVHAGAGSLGNSHAHHLRRRHRQPSPFLLWRPPGPNLSG